MELKEATERLLEIRDRHSKNVKMLEESKVYLKNTAFEDVLIERKKDIEVIDTVLKELDRLQIENKELEDDVGKTEEKIEELDIDSFTYGDEKRAILKTAFKLNEVIRRINNVR